MKITVYTITDCEFSKQEKEYLASHQLQYEEKNLETNKEFLTEMLAVSNNFAGTPVTKIEKDDGKIEILKGFTSADFDGVLGFETEKKEESPKKPEEKQDMKKPEDQKAPDEVKAEPVTPPNPGAAPKVQQTQPQTPQPTSSKPANPSPTPPPANDPLNSILADLQAKAEEPTTPPPASNPAAEQPAQSPSDGGLPKVPDFQSNT